MHVLDFPHSLTIEQGCRATMYLALHPVLCWGTTPRIAGMCPRDTRNSGRNVGETIFC